MLPFVITLTGPSQCGKSTIIDLLCKISEDIKFAEFNPKLIPKFTTRPLRKDEIELIKADSMEHLDVLPVLGNYNEAEIFNSADFLEMKKKAFQEKKCDLAYEQYGNRYGLRFSDIYDCLKIGQTPIIILNDVRAVEDVKTAFGRHSVCLFVFRETPNIQHFRLVGEKRHVTEQEIVARYEKAGAIYRMYIENIHIFDKLILNINEGSVELEKMLRQLVEYLCQLPQVFY